MTKGEFIDEVATRTGLSKKDAGAAVDAVLATISDTLKIPAATVPKFSAGSTLKAAVKG